MTNDQGPMTRNPLALPFVIAALLVLGSSFGCRGGPAAGQGARAGTEIEAGAGAKVEAKTEQRQQESSVEAARIGGAVQTRRYGPSPEQARLEGERIAAESARQTGVYVILGALLLLALAAPNIFPPALSGAAFVVGIIGILAGALLPQVLKAIV